MDNLQDIPPNDKTVKTPEEAAVMNQFFGPPTAVQPEEEDEKKSGSMNWKLLGGTIVLFIALANPLVNGILNSLPIGGSIGATLLKVVVFSVLLMGMMYFL